MQEAGNKLSRDTNKGSYRAFRKVVLMCIELIRQFYDVPRYFRILGQNGAEQFVSYSNAGIQPQPQGMMVNGYPMEAGVDVGYRLPEFDVDVTAQKQSPYTKMSQNELALQFYSAGFFAPANADAAMSCLDMMDFDRKDFVMQRIQQNGLLYQQLMATQQMAMQLAAALDSATGTQTLAAIQQQFGVSGAGGGNPVPGKQMAQGLDTLGGESGKEAKVTKNARTQAAEASAPR